jgi:hypothetical protein
MRPSALFVDTAGWVACADGTIRTTTISAARDAALRPSGR